MLIKFSGYFDKTYYLQNYSDVRDAKVDPLMHFIKHGWKERRNPSAKFRTKIYLELNPDVENENMNPLIHFLLHGNKEQRRIYAYKSENIHFDYVDLSAEALLIELVKKNAANPPQKADFIIFPMIDWFSRFQRPQQLARQLSEMGHRIFYIKTGFSTQETPKVKLVEKNIYLVQLSRGDSQIKFNTSLSDENIKYLEKSIRILRDTYLINAAIMLVDLPFWRNLVIRLQRQHSWKLVYDCMDLHSAFSISSDLVAIEEKKLLTACDLVFASSHLLFKHVQKGNDNVVLVQNGTNFDLFHKAKKPINSPILEGLSSPIIGYFGAIAEWFDSTLVGQLAALHPEWTFVLIGNTHMGNLSPMKGLSNIHLLGEKAHSELPAFLSNFDVCIIPFKQSPLTQAVNPVKLFEYLSAGKPVISTRLEEISHYKDYVRLAETTQEWETAIEKSLLEEKTDALLERRFEFARNNTWGKRAKTIEKEINQLFPKISIIVVSFNNFKFTQLCLDSLLFNTAYPNYEIIIVDNGSDEETIRRLQDYQSKHQSIQVVFNDKNLGFPKANNQGIALSEGEYIVFLNNDTMVTTGWLHRLLWHLDKNPTAGMVGAVTNSIGNEAKVNVNYLTPDMIKINTFAAQRAIQYSGQSFLIKVLALFCAMIPHELLEQVGGLDERYETGLFEDDDLAMKIREKGLELICAEDVFVHHFHGATFETLQEEKYQQIFAENKKKFEDKWGTTWEPHQHR